MTGFSEKFSAIKAKQEEADSKKLEEAKATEAESAREREAVSGELFSRQEKLREEFGQAEQNAREANEVMAEADAFAAQQGENLDPGVASEIVALKAEATEAGQRLEELRTALDSLTTEIQALGVTESVVVDDESKGVEESEPQQEQGVEKSKEESLAELQDALSASETELVNAKDTIETADYQLERYSTLLESQGEDLEGMVRINANRPEELVLVDVEKTKERQSELIENKQRYDSVKNRYDAKIAEFRANNPDLRNMGGQMGEDIIVSREPELQKMREQMKEIDPNNNFGTYASFDLNHYTVGTRHGEAGGMIAGMPKFEGEITRREAYEKISEYLKGKKEEGTAKFEHAQNTSAQLKSQIEELSSESPGS
ncbi:MAG: hypothetical protein ABIT47_02305 [Candidatus Paceibacterota bacterium]